MNFDNPWCFIGDFNTILGAHEYNGVLSAVRQPMQDFQTWTNTFDLFHIPSRGAAFTWDIGRSGRRHIKRRLDRVVCNKKLMDLCSSIRSSILLKSNFGHYPLLLEIKIDSMQFVSNFKFLKA